MTKLKLLTAQNKRDLPPLYSQEANTDVQVKVKFFAPWGSSSWYMTEYDPKTHLFFGYVTGQTADCWGYFDGNELESIRGPMGLSIERDTSWDATTLASDVIAKKVR